MNIKKLLLVLFELCIHFKNYNALEGESLRGGIEAPIWKYPFHVSLQHEGLHFCGGAIITSFYVVTAAHCVISTKTRKFARRLITVVSGVDDLDLQSSLGIISEVSEIHIPFEYAISYHLDKSGDIAVLKVDRALLDIVSPNLDYLRLPLEPTGFHGRIATVAGFGSSYLRTILNLDTNVTLEIIENPDGKLRSANILVLSDEECSRKKIAYQASKSRFCGKMIPYDGDEDVGVCYGDSGSPLVINTNILIGIVHSGPARCNESTSASVYTNVTTFLPFIKAVLAKDRYSGISFSFQRDKKMWRRMGYEELAG